MNEVIKDPNAKAAVIISAKPGSFIAGADITMLDAAKTEEEVNTVLIFSHSFLFFDTCFYIYFLYIFFAVTRNLKEWPINDTENGGMYMNYLIITSSLTLSLSFPIRYRTILNRL